MEVRGCVAQPCRCRHMSAGMYLLRVAYGRPVLVGRLLVGCLCCAAATFVCLSVCLRLCVAPRAGRTANCHAVISYASAAGVQGRARQGAGAHVLLGERHAYAGASAARLRLTCWPGLRLFRCRFPCCGACMVQRVGNCKCIVCCRGMLACG